MNGRILELAIKAGLYVDFNGKPWPKNMNGEDIEAAYTKFAELVVKECTSVIADKHRHNTEATLIKNVKKHFGM